MKPIDNYRKLLTVSIEQMNTSATVVTSLRERGILKVGRSSTIFDAPGMFDSTFTRSIKHYLDDHLAEHKILSEYKIRYGVATLLASIADMWALSLQESIDTLTELLKETKLGVEQMFQGKLDQTGQYDADNFNSTLLRFTTCVLYNYVVPNNRIPSLNDLDEPADDLTYPTLSQITPVNELTDTLGRPGVGVNDSYFEEEYDAPETNLSAVNGATLVDNNAAFELYEMVSSDQPQVPASTVVNEIRPKCNQLNENPPTVNLTHENILKCIGQNPLSHVNIVGVQAPLDKASENQQSNWITLAELDAYSTDQLLDRITKSDAELLSSLRSENVLICSDCLSTGLKERKTETLEGKHYCSTCRKRVQVVYGPLYHDAYTTNPVEAVRQHRSYLKTRLDILLAQLKWIELYNISSIIELPLSPYLPSQLAHSYDEDVSSIAGRFANNNLNE